MGRESWRETEKKEKEGERNEGVREGEPEGTALKNSRLGEMWYNKKKVEDSRGEVLGQRETK